MIIFHAGFFDGQLHLWGEAPVTERPESSIERKASASKAKSQPAKRLPYDAGGETILAALSEIIAGAEVDESDARQATVWLPTVEGQPIASSPLIAEPPSPDQNAEHAKATIAPWEVVALPLTMTEAVELLCRAVGRETLATGVIV